MKKNNERTVSIIGTGLSSIFSCLRISEALSVRIQVFDKARGLGGRLATRRADGGRFDHGAQYMKINEISNLKEIEKLINNNIITNNGESERFFSPTGMTNIAKFLLKDFDIKKEHKLLSINKDKGHYILNFENNETIPTDDIILTCPMPQTIEILSNSDIDYDYDALNELKQLEYHPCIVVMIKSKNKLLNLNKELGSELDFKNISWVGDNYIKKVSEIENFYTVQCSPKFSLEHFDLEYEEINQILNKNLKDIFGSNYEVMSNHKWRYSIPKNFYQKDSSLILDSSGFIGICGDIFTNGKVDGAIKSGISMAEKYIKYEI
tara:strand:- start:1841 stop:2806 length:966 start_codon:yes stop_codon:yes gene_type:complete